MGFNRVRSYWVRSIKLVTVMAFVAIAMPKFVGAQVVPTWTNTDPTIVSRGNIETNECRLQRIPIAIQPITVDQTLRYESVAQGCVTYGKTIDFAVWGRYAYVKFTSERLYHRLAVSIYDNPKLIPGTDTFFKGEYRNGASQPTILMVYRNLASSLTPIERNSRGIVTMYSLDQSAGSRLMGNFANPADGWVPLRDVISYAVSSNARYVLSYVDYKYIVKTDIDTGQNTVVREVKSAWYQGFDIPVAAAISNDGRDAYVSKQEEIIDMDSCGDNTVTENQAHLVKECPSKILETNIQARAGYLAYTTDHKFSDDGKSLEVIASPRSRRFTQFQQMWIGIAGLPTPKTLDYLALGDSYTSGEGDVERSADAEKLSFYITDTSKYSKFCHLSSRSYPFLLRQYYRFANDKMESVACSGARVVQDYTSLPELYYGQKKDLIKFSDKDRIDIQTLSLNTPKPGVTPQLEFVKKYKPKTVTIMGGGNDVGFADILKYCAAPEMIANIPSTNIKLIPVVYTCDYAIRGTKLEKMLYGSIDTQYRYMSDLIGRMKVASPNSDIIIVGYPSFIKSEGLTVCSFNSATLDISEIRMINSAVSYMNAMLKRVAYDEGVKFADIEDSLTGGRLCEGSKYMTGLYNIDALKMVGGKLDQQLFHPNAKGHEQIAKAIERSGVLWESSAEDPGNYQVSNDNSAYQMDLIYGGTIVKTNKFTKVSLGPNIVAAHSSVQLANYSQETNLGTFETAGDGSLDLTLPAEVLPIGRHVLTLTGTTPSGEPLTLYQYITVGQTATDFDADDVFDTQDSCLFISSWIDEQTGEDVCKQTPISSGVKGSRNSSEQAEKAKAIAAEAAETINTREVGEDTRVLGNAATSSDSRMVLSAKQHPGNSQQIMWWLLGAGIVTVGGLSIYATKHKKR